MTEWELTQDLAEYLADCLSRDGFDSPDEGIAQRRPRPICGFFPPKKANITDFPFVMVVPSSGSTNFSGEQLVKIDIYLGTFSKNEQGAAWLFNGLTEIRNALFGKEGYLLEINGKTYEIDNSFSWNYTPAQDFPFWEIAIHTQFRLPATIPARGLKI